MSSSSQTSARKISPPGPPGGELPFGLTTCRRISGFLPTPSARRATARPQADAPAGRISTHALREEGDADAASRPRRHKQFLPTPSARRATDDLDEEEDEEGISTHALREEGDSQVSIVG